MTTESYEHLLGWWTAFDDPFVWITSVAAVVVLTASGIAIQLLKRSGRINAALFQDMWLRWKSWLWLALLMLIPILLGAAWVIVAVAVLSLLCFSEYARATGLFREKLLCAVVVFGVLALTFASADNYSRLYFALGPLIVGFLAIVTIPQDRPHGYIQRTALAVMGFLLLGHGLGYLALIANSAHYRSLLLLILIGVEANDVFAYCVGKTIGGPKLIPNTSPGKTIAGSIGALVLTTALVATLGHVIFHDTAMDRLELLLVLGAGMSILGQYGDLLLSSIKRDLGLKDLGVAIPGHGGMLDRFDSLVLVPPAAFHFLSLHLGPLNGAFAERILTGG
ncbi:MAG TPA: phosphatidate cytidylyltransferase [Gemmataceae bacterium]|nr:phosphatidate cytidylyltransferase [Gemmataceae bacterium]